MELEIGGSDDDDGADCCARPVTSMMSASDANHAARCPGSRSLCIKVPADSRHVGGPHRSAGVAC